jgi:hypothetical protein
MNDTLSVPNPNNPKVIDEVELRRTKIRGCLCVPIWEIKRYEKELEKQMSES